MSWRPVFFLLLPSTLFAQSLLQPDSFVTVLRPQPAHESRFVFSPTHPAAIWIDGQEVKVLTGAKEKITPDYEWQWHTSQYEWHADPFDTTCLWATFAYDGLFRWGKKTHQLTLITPALKDLSAFLPTQQGVWLAEGSDLYFWDRSDRHLRQEKNYPAYKNIRHLEAHGDTLIVNDFYRYVPGDCKLSAIEERYEQVQGPEVVFRLDENGFSLRRIQHFSYPVPQSFVRTPEGREFCFGKEFWLERGRVAMQGRKVWLRDYEQQLKILDTETGAVSVIHVRGLPRYGGLQANHDYLWMQGDKGLTGYDPATQRFFALPDTFSSGLQHFRCDDFNLYLLFHDRFTVVNIAWLLHQIKDKTEDWDEEERFWAAYQPLLADSLADLNFALERYRLLKKQFGRSGNPSVQQKLKDAPLHFSQVIRNSPADALDQATSDLQDGQMELEIVPHILHGLIDRLGAAGRVQEAAGLVARYAEAIGYEPDEQVFYPIRTAAAALDSLLLAPLPPDARLYAEGVVMYRYCHESIWFYNDDSGCVDTELANERFRRLLREYPNGEWADDAAFDTLPFRSESCPGRDAFRHLIFSLGPEVFEAYRKALDDYPRGNNRSQVLYRLASLHYYQASHFGKNQSQQHLGEISACLEELAQNYPEYLPEKVQALRKGLQRMGWNMIWYVGLRAVEDTVRAGVPLRVTLHFRNRDTVPHQLDRVMLNDLVDHLRLETRFRALSECNDLPLGFAVVRRVHPVSSSSLPVVVQPYENHQIALEILHPASATAWQPGRYRFQVDGAAQRDWSISGTCHVVVSLEH